MGPQFFVDGGFVCTYKGITRLLGRGSVRITPAHAGKSFSSSMALCRCRDHPRTRGEKSKIGVFSLVLLGSPPHTRGKGVWLWEGQAGPRITPARAGKRSRERCSLQCTGDHPRACGEKQHKPCPCACFLGITPARAGKSRGFR